MDRSFYYVHQIDPFIFTVGGLTLFTLIMVGFVFSILLSYRLILSFFSKKIIGPRFLKKILLKNPSHLKKLDSVLVYFFFFILIIIGLRILEIDWGPRWYSLMYLFAFVAVFFGMNYEIKKNRLYLTPELVVSFMTYVIIGMILGARLFYVFIYDWDQYREAPLDIIATWKGGLSFHGGILGVIIAVFIFSLKHKISFFHLTDRGCIFVPLGIFMGRIGNFINGELWGRPTDVPWAVIFPMSDGLARHPSQLYQALGEGLCFFIILFLLSKKSRPEGQLSVFFILLYALFRFPMEYFREADHQVSYFSLLKGEWISSFFANKMPFWSLLTMGQILCVLLFIISGALLFLTRNNVQEGSKEWVQRKNKFLQALKK